MTEREIIRIDKEKCNGCGQCVTACAEGAIAIIDGKAELVSEVYCDGLGACLGHCPMDAITIERREAPAFDEEAVRKHLERQKAAVSPPQGCPGMKMMQRTPLPADAAGPAPSQLGQWPVQLQLVSPTASYFAGSDLLIAADCVAFAMGDFHNTLLKGRSLAIACPKLDETDGYVEKLARIISLNELHSLTVARMEVPCCSGLVRLVSAAREMSGIRIDLKEIVLSLDGGIKAETIHPAE